MLYRLISESFDIKEIIKNMAKRKNFDTHLHGIRKPHEFPGFLIRGLSEKPESQSALLGLFLSLYLATVFGNLLIILAVSSDPHLPPPPPMYFLLSNLSFVDICFTSTPIPKALLNILMESKTITYAGCITHMYFFTVFGLVDNLLLIAMAYDPFMATCHPLLHTGIMRSRLCASYSS
ncbi:Olfactory Receptor 7A17 [Manis pentadactyla]|nr:Olfactory Receptor 7A17 [Manis pentadactyla]